MSTAKKSTTSRKGRASAAINMQPATTSDKLKPLTIEEVERLSKFVASDLSNLMVTPGTAALIVLMQDLLAYPDEPAHLYMIASGLLVDLFAITTEFTDAVAITAAKYRQEVLSHG
jgi:hypothetical protein